MVKWHIAIGQRLRKTAFGDMLQQRRRSACASAQSHQQLWFLLFGSHIFNVLASLVSRGDWFETRFVRSPEDRFSRVVASYNSVACSTALEQILQVQQIIIFKIMIRKLFIRFVNGNHIIKRCSTSSNTQVIRNYSPQSGERRRLWFSGCRPLVCPWTYSSFARLVRRYKWLVAIICFAFMH